MPIVWRTLVFRALYSIGKLRGCGTTGVVAVRKNWRIQHRLNEGGRIEKQALATWLLRYSTRDRSPVDHLHVSWRSVGIAKIQSHRNDRCIDSRRSAFGWRIPERV